MRPCALLANSQTSETTTTDGLGGSLTGIQFASQCSWCFGGLSSGGGGCWLEAGWQGSRIKCETKLLIMMMMIEEESGSEWFTKWRYCHRQTVVTRSEILYGTRTTITRPCVHEEDQEEETWHAMMSTRKYGGKGTLQFIFLIIINGN